MIRTENNRAEKAHAYIIVTFFVLSLIPLLYIARYLHPTTDDYVYGAEAYHVWNATHSLWQTVQAALQVTSRIYHDWQGTYSACFLMAMQPDAFGLYWITPFVMILPFVAVNYWLAYLLLCKYLHADKWQYLIVSTTLITMSMQCMPSPVDAYYWYNGAIYYTFYYALCLLLLCMVIGYTRVSSKLKRTLYGIGACLLCVFIAGGNYVTGLFVPVVLCAAIFLFRLNGRRVPFLLYPALILFLAAFTFSIIAPGNAVRAGHEHSISALHAIGISFTNGCHYIARFTTPTTAALFAFLLPILYRLAGKSRFSFSHPLWVVLGSYCIYCTLFTPTCYALGFPGYERNFNLYFYCYVWLVAGNLFYVSGAIRRRAARGSAVCKDLTSLAAHLKDAGRKYRRYSYVVTLFLFGITIIQSKASSKKAFRDLTKGRAAAYHQAMEGRLKAYQSDKADIVVPPLKATETPYTLFAFDVTSDKGHWINQGIAFYYGKHSVMTDDTHLTEKEKEEQRVRFRREAGPGNILYKESSLENLSRH